MLSVTFDPVLANTSIDSSIAAGFSNTVPNSGNNKPYEPELLTNPPPDTELPYEPDTIWNTLEEPKMFE